MISLDGKGWRRCCDLHHMIRLHTGSEVIMADRIHVTIFWDVTSCRLVSNKIPEDSTASTRRQYTLPLFLFRQCQYLKVHRVEWQDTVVARGNRSEEHCDLIIRNTPLPHATPIIISEVTPTSRNRYPQYRRLSRERNSVLK